MARRPKRPGQKPPKGKRFNKGLYDRLDAEDKKAYMSTDPIMSSINAKSFLARQRQDRAKLPVWQDRDVKKRGSKLGG